MQLNSIKLLFASINNNKFTQLIILSLIVRIITVLLIGKEACMEPSYLYQGQQIFQGNAETLYLSSLYSILVYLLTSLFGSLFIASAVIFIVGSTTVSIMLYLICTHLFDKKVAMYALFFAIFLPNLTVAISGFAHSVILGTALDLAAIYCILIYYENVAVRSFIWLCLFSMLSIYIRPETLIIIVSFFTLYGIYRIYQDVELKNKFILNGLIYFIFYISCMFCE